MKTAVAFASLAILASVASCKKDQTQDPQTPNPGYGQPTGGYPQNPGTYPQPTATTTTPPNPLALACQTDATCITAKCNLQTGHCMFPCASSAECQPGNGCVAGACIPGAP